MWLTSLLFCQMMVYNGVATVLYLTAFATNAATVYFGNGHLGAAAVSHPTLKTLHQIQRPTHCVEMTSI